MNYLKKFKKTIFWKYFLIFFLKPLYDLFWCNIINIHGRIIYFLYFFKKRKQEYISLNGNDKKLITHSNLSYLVKKIKLNLYEKKINELINNAIKSRSYENEKKINESNSGKNLYKISLLETIEPSLKKEIVDFGMSDLMIATAAKYLRVFPILAKITLYLNFPTALNKEARGAMLWHKDDFGYKSLDLFTIISDVDISNGPLYALKNKIKLGVLERISQEKKNPILGERGKIEETTFSSNFSEDNIIELSGQSGNALLIDSFTAYHKGGHCISKPRIMLRYSYQTIDSVRLPENEDGAFYYYKKIKKKEIDNIFIKFLLFKRSSMKNSLKINKFLLKFYRFISYKI